MAKPHFQVETEGDASNPGVTPTWDGTYLFDDPNLYFDQLYPANTTHIQGGKPKLIVDNKEVRNSVQLEVERSDSKVTY